MATSATTNSVRIFRESVTGKGTEEILTKVDTRKPRRRKQLTNSPQRPEDGSD
jgi:hypothetical protein